MTDWALQDAKNKFSALVNAAMAGNPQRVTRRGEPVVVIIAEEEYARLQQCEKASVPTFGQLLTQIPQDMREFERLSLPARSLKT